MSRLVNITLDLDAVKLNLDNCYMSSPDKTKNPYHHGDLASALVQATVSLLRSKGPAGVSLREVARLAGVSHGAPAHHFGDKAGLFTAVAIEGHELLAASLRYAIAKKSTPLAQLLDVGETYVRFALHNPGHFNCMFQTELINAKSTEYLAASLGTKLILEQCVWNLFNDPDQRATQINGIVMALWSQVHGFATLWLAGNFGDPDDEKLLNRLLPEMLTGITPNT